MLKNEKYCGDSRLQKKVTRKVGTSLRSVNNGLRNQYYIEDNHEAIISKELFERAQQIRKERASVVKREIGTPRSEDSPYREFVYSPVAHKFYRAKTSKKGSMHELRILAMFKSGEGAGLPPLHQRQIEEIMDDAINEIKVNFKAFKGAVLRELALRIKSSGIKKKANTLETNGKEIEDRLLGLSNLPIDQSAKNAIKERLTNEKLLNDNSLVALRYDEIMNYNYDRKLVDLEKKFKFLEKEKLNYRAVFSTIIAIDREHLLLCIHLSNKNFKDINLDGQVYNEAIISGLKEFNQHD